MITAIKAFNSKSALTIEEIETRIKSVMKECVTTNFLLRELNVEGISVLREHGFDVQGEYVPTPSSPYEGSFEWRVSWTFFPENEEFKGVNFHDKEKETKDIKNDK